MYKYGLLLLCIITKLHLCKSIFNIQYILYGISIPIRTCMYMNVCIYIANY